MQADTATTTIGKILTHSCGDGIYDVIDVIGELTDNVWAHGRALGYAVAQVQGIYIRFAIADLGCGFRQVLHEAGIGGIENDLDAINWSLQEGHTTNAYEDDWAQSLPFDSHDNPFSEGVPIRDDDNHHEGLGLYKLVDLAEKTEGEVSILSGHGLKVIRAEGNSDKILSDYWQGVVVSCVFSLPKLKNYSNLSSWDALDTIIAQPTGVKND